jgi:hypothetical protein
MTQHVGPEPVAITTEAGAVDEPVLFAELGADRMGGTV